MPEITPEIIDAILEEYESGRMSYSAACRKHGITRRGLNKKAAGDPELKARLDAAKDEGNEAVHDSILDIADELHTDPACRKVRIYAREKYLANRDPAKFGAKVRQEHSGGVSVQVVTGVPAPTD